MGFVADECAPGGPKIIYAQKIGCWMPVSVSLGHPVGKFLSMDNFSNKKEGKPASFY